MGIGEHFTPHDLRRTLRTRLAELGVSDIVAEKLLGHKFERIVATYNRHSYANEKREALGKWETSLRKIMGIKRAQPGKVIRMEVRRRA
jgi:integrase